MSDLVYESSWIDPRSFRFGGVIPGFAQTLHEANIGPVVEKAMARSGLRYDV